MISLIERPAVRLSHDGHQQPSHSSAAEEPATLRTIERFLETVRQFVPSHGVALVQRTNGGQPTILCALGDLKKWHGKMHALIRQTERNVDEYGVGGSTGSMSDAAGTPQVLGGQIGTEGRGDVFLLTMRPPTESFEAADRHALSAFLPLARNILELCEVSGAMAQRCRMMMEVLDAAPTAAVVVNEEGAIIHANRRGRDLMGSLSAVPGLRPCAPGASDEAETQMVELPDMAEPSPAHIVKISSGHQRAIYFKEPPLTSSLSQEVMQRAYSLTPTEIAVARLLCKGCSLHVIGARLGIQYETVRTHLKRTYQKTGTERQAQLVSMLLTGPAQITR